MLTGLTTASKQTWTFNFQNRVLFQQVGEEANDLETQVDAQLVERLDMEALPSGSKQVKNKNMESCRRKQVSLQVSVVANVVPFKT